MQMAHRARQALHYPTLNSALTTGGLSSHERPLEKRSLLRYKQPCRQVPPRGCGQGFQTQTHGQRQSPHKVDGPLDSGHSTLPAPPPGFLGECFQTRLRWISNVFIAYLRNTPDTNEAHTKILHILLGHQLVLTAQYIEEARGLRDSDIYKLPLRPPSCTHPYKQRDQTGTDCERTKRSLISPSCLTA